ncbi:pantoate--beta-alanine ligase [Alkalilimnicola ehrlichii]|uniref:Pantothenate synthetase n=1 Tax=Alkalilimnicola ehrlichii TaxID=351052 RepID=A0A3E0WYD2_9GAMM|nr:pantoate--beta-alanine ligase [Alkalilimnicola ehrlichii]RFA30457.1 pantoate--beta-alanine ligase [Alkalilimnicola ehrlichii]RFA38010.1 pantoate--beta-alanine ligase [Alkalilimnicola ehrlichii]
MRIVHTVRELREQVAAWRSAGERVGLVPTMGNLHRGHLDLAERMRAAADRVVVSIFVNPLQFGEGEDFEHYPRTLAADSALLEPIGVDIVFAPNVSEVYPDGLNVQTRVDVPALGGILCGASRPGHFAGVATVVTKLFNMVQPDLAIFGKKDYQQLQVIKRMVRDLNLPVEIMAAETVREADGLAMSSRNGYLSPVERQKAALLAKALNEAATRLEAGEHDFRAIEAWVSQCLDQGGFKTDYVSLRRQGDLAEPQPGDKELILLAAARLGPARLIDNKEVRLISQS